MPINPHKDLWNIINPHQSPLAIRPNRSSPVLTIFIDREAGEIIRLVASVRLSMCLCVCWRSPVWTVWPTCVCVFVGALLFEPFDLWPWFLAWALTLTLARLGFQVKVIGQSSRSNSNKSCFDITFWCLSTCFKVKGRDQGQRSRSRYTNIPTYCGMVARSGRYYELHTRGVVDTMNSQSGRHYEPAELSMLSTCRVAGAMNYAMKKWSNLTL